MANLDVNNVLASDKEPAPDLGSNPDNRSNQDGSGKSEEGKQIVIDGPLSEIYTQALNVVYAKKPLDETASEDERRAAVESQATEVVAMAGKVLLAQQDEAELRRQVTYAFVTDTGTLDRTGVNDAINRIVNASDSPNVSRVVLAVEAYHGMSNSVARLCNVAASRGVKIFYSRNAAMTYLGNC